MCILEARDLQYSYGNKKHLLRGINARMEPGKMYAIVGPSGCGKTTLLSLLGGLDSPTDGQVLCQGEDISLTDLAEHRRHHVAFVFQSYNLIDYLTPIENVALTAKVPPLPILEQLGLTATEAGRNVLRLSGGQQQRVAIARALASDAPIILADEPTGNLDEETAADITSILQRSAHESGRCIVIVTHSHAVAEAADTVFHLHKGSLEKLDKVGTRTSSGKKRQQKQASFVSSSNA